MLKSPAAPPPMDAALLDLDDPVEPSMEALIARAAAAEDAAMAVPGITNSEGASASWSRSFSLLATSRGFAGMYPRSYHGVSVTAIAGTGTAMQRDYDSSSAVPWRGSGRPGLPRPLGGGARFGAAESGAPKNRETAHFI